MLLRMNRMLEKYLPLITPVSLALGVLFSAELKGLSYLIPWIFAFITFTGSLSSSFSSLKRVMTTPLPLVIAMLILHVIMPLWAWGIGLITFQEDIFTMTGLILGMIIPTGITSFLWVSIYKGNIALTLSIILIDTILSPLIVPLTLSLFVGEKVEMDVLHIMMGLFGMVVLPSLLGMVLNQYTKGRIKEVWSPRLSPFSKICLGIVVMINGSVVAPYIQKIDFKLAVISIVVLIIAFTGYLFSFIIGFLFKRDKETIIALTFSGGMRNISAGAVLAVSYFPAPVAVPVVIGMLFQQLLASFFGFVINRYFKTREIKEMNAA
ncbi:bile acid:sodium symporter family protein [Litchfieldia salsa]|uniref:Predicted Na+-dependent transporter n=1 Tax=Litchfieldia salsa TaxID=930152 RepID=A0A1H0RQE2_9BACI|nr:bile acid:sodium symporter family protein [Litchfieldia salsa]SDP31579.1 Predicted Na+-dependent transporter [Litchfieldia salsa]